MGMDLIILEVLRHKFDVIADEMEIALLKSAYSRIVKEGMDASSALFTTGGETIAHETSVYPAPGRVLTRRYGLAEAAMVSHESATLRRCGRMCDRRVTVLMACEPYGVVLQEPGLSVDQEATQRLRTALRAPRVGG